MSIFSGSPSIVPGRASRIKYQPIIEPEPPGGNMSKPYPTDVLTKLAVAITIWLQIDPKLKIGSLSAADYQATLDHAKAIQTEISNLEAHLTDLRNQRDQVNSQSWNYVIRLRAAIKGIYGDDSSQYEMIGGTRRSDRKTRSRKARVEQP